jgi:hypothetical protein
MSAAGAVAAHAAELSLRCQPGRAGGRLTFPYVLENAGAADIFVMDAIATPGPDGAAMAADDQAVVIILGAAGEAILGKFPAPLPPDRRTAHQILPLARRLPPGGRLERALEVKLPLAETSPYFADLTLRDYEMVDLASLVFTIGYWRAGENGVAAAPEDGLPDLWRVATRGKAAGGHAARQRFPVKGLQLFKRLDAFPRPGA